MVASRTMAPSGLFAAYRALGAAFDELYTASGPRDGFGRLAQLLDAFSPHDFARSQQLAEVALLTQGVTFSVYADSRGTEKIFPFCLVPRPVSAQDFARLDKGLRQRLTALGMFLDDIYGEQRIL